MGECIMAHLQERIFERVERDGRFTPLDTEYFSIGGPKDGSTLAPLIRVADTIAKPFEQSQKPRDVAPKPLNQWLPRESLFRCVFQRSRPAHVSGRPDHLPFENAAAMRSIWSHLGLPPSYLQISDGSTGVAQASVVNAADGRARAYEVVAHCISKQGDWAMVLSHESTKGETSLFWSVDGRIDADELLNDLSRFQAHACHPMLALCIMYAALLRMSEQRRRSIKDRLAILENALHKVAVSEASHTNDTKVEKDQDGSQGLESLFDILYSCGKDQTSRDGRYAFWRSFNDAIDAGFRYTDAILHSAPTAQLATAHSELLSWKAICFHKFESLMARDKDHINRVENISNMLYNLIQQRDIRIQSSIAKAARQDSEDMKFIAVLGSVFLPASLVATILNVPEFQFAGGATLFGAYLAITIPFMALVLLLYGVRPHWRRLRAKQNVPGML